MAIENIKKNRLARTLLNDTFLQTEQIMRQSCKGYRLKTAEADAADLLGETAKANRLRNEAYEFINRIPLAPKLRKQRIDDLVLFLTDKLGTQANAVAYLDDALVRYGVETTRQELMTHLNTLVAISDTVLDGNINLGWTLDQVADYIEANTSDDDPMYAILETTFPDVPDLIR